MTISREKFEQIALEVAKHHWKRDQWNIEYFNVVGNANALVARLEKEAKVVSNECKWKEGWARPINRKLIALPLVEPEGE